MTIFSKHLDQVSMLWSKDGTVNWIDSNLRSGDLWILPRNDDNNSTFELDEDEYVNQEEWQEQLEIEKNCADGSCDDEIQRVHHLEYNVSFLENCLKITQNVLFEFFNFGISANFCPIKIKSFFTTVVFR